MGEGGAKETKGGAMDVEEGPASPRALRRLYTPEHMELRAATAADDSFLYGLLRERYAHEHSNIPGMASKQLPSYEQHCEYLRGNPYRRVEIVVVDGQSAGLMYLTHGNVGGCFILDAFAGRGLALSACYTFFKGESYPVIAHFNSANRAGYRTADRLGWTLVRTEPHRLTYELRQEPINPFAHLGQSAAERRSARGS